MHSKCEELQLRCSFNTIPFIKLNMMLSTLIFLKFHLRLFQTYACQFRKCLSSSDIEEQLERNIEMPPISRTEVKEAESKTK